MSDQENHPVSRPFFRIPFLPSLWEEMEDRLGRWGVGEGNSGVSVSEDDQHVYVEAHLPGLKSDQIDISLNQNTLWIKGEKEDVEEKRKKYYRKARSSFIYQVELPNQVEESSEVAQFEDGVLKISFNKTKQSQARKIAIKNDKDKE